MIVGAGLAGVSAAAALREEGFDGAITLVGAESQLPYDRPPLSKEYLRGEKPFEKILLKPEGFYQTQDIEVLLGAAVSGVDVQNRLIEIPGRQDIGYDRLLIATGSRNRRLEIPGRDLEGVLDLRSVADCDQIRSKVASGRKAVLVGMGFIGSEVAASLTQAGVEVTIIEALETPFEHILGQQIGRAVENLHREHGVRIRTGETVASFQGSYHVESVTTGSGDTIVCDFALVGVGVEPVTEQASGAGIEADNGIVVDAFCRTSAADVFAAGDVTRHFHPIPGRPIRVEHWQNALKQGQAAARNMLGIATEYAEVHWFWSDQYDCNIQYTGFHGDWDELVIRGNVQERKFAGFYLNRGRVAAAVAMNNGRDLRRAKELVRAGARIDPAVLADPDADLRKLVPDGG